MKIPKSIKLNVAQVNDVWVVEIYWTDPYFRFFNCVWLARHKSKSRALEIAYGKVSKLKTAISREWGKI